MKEKEIIYTLRMGGDLFKAAYKAIELLMRLKINQPEEICRAVISDDYLTIDGKVDPQKFDEYISRRDRANKYFKAGFDEIFPYSCDLKKDDEWYRLYNLYQVIRYQIHLAEHPNSTGVDSYKPLRFTDVELPEGSYEIKT